MSIITGFISDTGLEVDTTSKAAHITLYDSSGKEVQVIPVGSYILPINIRQTSAASNDTTVFMIRSGAGRIASIRRITGSIGFDGTLAATTTVRYGFFPFVGTSAAGGTIINPINKRSNYPSSTVEARFADTGLTVTGVYFRTEFLTLGTPVSKTGTFAPEKIIFENENENYGSFELAPNDGLAIKLQTAAVTGTSLTGSISWDEFVVV